MEKEYGIGSTAAPERPSGEPPPHDGQRPLVLVVEDDRHDWEIYGKILWYNGFDVLYAPDGEAGWSLARQHRPDLILLDLMVPKLDGLSLCRRLMADPSLRSMPVVILSGRAEHEVGAEARAAGCALYLEKPVSPVDVLHEVEALIGRPPAAGVGRPPTKHPAAA